jgi:hypothetical protein
LHFAQQAFTAQHGEPELNGVQQPGGASVWPLPAQPATPGVTLPSQFDKTQHSEGDPQMVVGDPVTLPLPPQAGEQSPDTVPPQSPPCPPPWQLSKPPTQQEDGAQSEVPPPQNEQPPLEHNAQQQKPPPPKQPQPAASKLPKSPQHICAP